MSEGALDVSEDTVQLTLPEDSKVHKWEVRSMLEDIYELSSHKVNPTTIDIDAIKAKFSKKTGNLRITIPCIS